MRSIFGPTHKLVLSLLVAWVPSVTYSQNISSAKKDFAASLGVSEEEVAPILQRQYDALQLANTLKREIPDDYAGMRLSPSKNFSATVFLKSGDASVLRRFTTDPVYKVKGAKRSLNELYAVLEQVQSILDAEQLNYGAFIDLDEQIIQVSLPDPQMARQILKGLEDKKFIRVVREDLTLVPTVLAGDLASVGSFNCTSGFSVQHNDGRRGVLTAGHCPNTSMSSGGTTSIAYVAGLLNSTNRRDIQWHSKSSGSFEPKIKVTGGSTLQVNGDFDAEVGAVICLNGQQSGNRCGKVVSLGFSGNSRELTAPNTLIPVADAVVIEAATPGTLMCTEGDSGGPVYSTTWNYLGEAFAHGVEFAGLPAYEIGSYNPRRFSRCVYQKVTDASMLGLRVLSNVAP